jgi:DNA replication protein DnaC
MCEVFGELTKKDRKQRQILIGSPGVGTSVLLFLVALHRVLTDGISTCFVRKPKDSQEFTSVFFYEED